MTRTALDALEQDLNMLSTKRVKREEEEGSDDEEERTVQYSTADSGSELSDGDFYFDEISKTINEFLPRFELEGLPIDERMASHARSTILHNETLRMLHVSVMEKLLHPDFGFGVNPIERLISKHGLMPTFVIPIVSLNDHRDALGFALSMGTRIQVQRKVYTLNKAYQKLWALLNVKVSVRVPSYFSNYHTRETLKSSVHRSLEFLVVKFDGYMNNYHEIHGLHNFYHMASGNVHRLENLYNKVNPRLVGGMPARPRLINTIDCGITTVCGINAPGFVDYVKRLINQHDLHQWHEDKDGLLECERSYRKGKTDGHWNRAQEQMFRFLMFKQYSADHRFPFSLDFTNLHFVWSYLFDFNFACMIHMHIGSSYRMFKCPIHDAADHCQADPYLSVRCNTMDDIFVKSTFPVLDIGDTDRAIRFRTCGDVVPMQGFPNANLMDWTHFNWHKLYASRHSELIVPYAYWNYVENLAWLSDEIYLAYDGCTQLHLWNIHCVSPSTWVAQSCPVRSTNINHTTDAMYLALISKHVLIDAAIVNEEEDTINDIGLMLLHEDSEHFKARQVFEHRARNTVWMDPLPGHMELNGVQYQFEKNFNLRQLYLRFKDEFDEFRPHLTHLKSYFLDDISG